MYQYCGLSLSLLVLLLLLLLGHLLVHLLGVIADAQLTLQCGSQPSLPESQHKNELSKQNIEV